MPASLTGAIARPRSALIDKMSFGVIYLAQVPQFSFVKNAAGYPATSFFHRENMLPALCSLTFTHLVQKEKKKETDCGIIEMNALFRIDETSSSPTKENDTDNVRRMLTMETIYYYLHAELLRDV